MKYFACYVSGLLGFWLAACGGLVEMGNGNAGGGGGSGGVGGASSGVGGSSPGVGGSLGDSSGGTTSPTAFVNCGQALTTLPSKRIVFDSLGTDNNRDIYTVRLDAAGLTRLTSDSSREYQPAYSPDSTRLLFTSDREGTAQVFMMDLASRAISRLTNHAEGADEPSFSRDGSLVAFHSGASVYVINADGSNERLVGTGLDTFNTYAWPQFSSNGTQLVFDRNNEIDVLNLDGSGFRFVVGNTTTIEKRPTVSPDGHDVVVDVGCSSQLMTLWLSPFASTTQACQGLRITPVDTLSSEHAAWGPGDLLVYERVDLTLNRASLAVISTTGKDKPCNLPAFSSDDRDPSWVP